MLSCSDIIKDQTKSIPVSSQMTGTSWVTKFLIGDHVRNKCLFILNNEKINSPKSQDERTNWARWRSGHFIKLLQSGRLSSYVKDLLLRNGSGCILQVAGVRENARTAHEGNPVMDDHPENRPLPYPGFPTLRTSQLAVLCFHFWWVVPELWL